MSFIRLPSNEFSPVHFILRELDDWRNLKSIFLDTMSYVKMEKSPNLVCENGIWKSKNLCENFSYTPFSYKVTQIRFDLWCIEWIEFKGIRYYFATTPIKSTLITAE